MSSLFYIYLIWWSRSLSPRSHTRAVIVWWYGLSERMKMIFSPLTINNPDFDAYEMFNANALISSLISNPCKLQNKMRTFFLHKLDLTKLIFFRPHFFVCWPWLVLAVNAPSVSFRVSNLVPTSLIMWSTIAAAATLSRPPPSHSSLKSITSLINSTNYKAQRSILHFPPKSTTIQDPNFPYLHLTAIPINNLWHQQIFSSHHPTKVYPHSVLCPSSSNLLLLFQSLLLTN